MDVSHLLTNQPPPQAGLGRAIDTLDNNNPRPHTRQMDMSHDQTTIHNVYCGMTDTQAYHMNGVAGSGGSPQAYDSPRPTPKTVSFELLIAESAGPQHRARLPMRVSIFPHDATDSIITTVKNFYGLYETRGISFEDKNGNTLIARYENFDDKMTVYVRTIADDVDFNDGHVSPVRQSLSPRRPRLEPPIQMLPPQLYQGQITSRPSSRTARNRSLSPSNGRNRRSASASTNPKSRPRSAPKNRATGSYDGFGEAAGELNDYSDSDGGNASVTSSRRGKNEILASAEISVENIVEGGRRNRAKFDSSELPLFVPSQVPMTASASSVSPQRRIGTHTGASPFTYSTQPPFVYPQPLPSPQSHGQEDVQKQNTGHGAQPYGNRLRQRGQVQYVPTRPGGGYGVLPTPDPTIGSVISDEDVALQLMRLGDVSNFSHGRTSTSTVDDALSGKAEAASSDEEMDDEDQQPLPNYSHLYAYSGQPGHVGEYSSGEEYEDYQDGSFKGESDEVAPDEHGVNGPSKRAKLNNGQAIKSRSNSAPALKANKQKKSSVSSIKARSKAGSVSKGPISPTSLSSQSRKASNASLNFQHQLGVDEEDLSTKPRCQRCRKSKKGCDRQRPCQRCKDAGIGIEGCVSEDEGNGRKGRYGRHMGVPVKKLTADGMSPPTEMQPPSAFPPYASTNAASLDKNKKRKR